MRCRPLAFALLTVMLTLLPVVGDFLGDGFVDYGYYNTETGEWFIAMTGGMPWRFVFGSPGDGDLPVAVAPDRVGGDTPGPARTRFGIFRPHTGEFFIWNGDGSLTYRCLRGPCAAP